MATLLELPLEIKHQIYDNLAKYELTALCRTSKALRYSAEPLLYQSIKWTWSVGQVPPIKALLRSLATRPELCAHVRSVHLAGYDLDIQELDERLPGGIAMYEVLDSEWNCLSSLVRDTAGLRRDFWLQQLHAGSMDAFVSLLIARVPNLEQLYVGPSFTRECRLLGEVLWQGLREPRSDSALSRFQHLRDVCFAVKPGEDSQRPARQPNTTNVMPFFYLPALRRLSTSVDNPDGPFSWPADPPIASTLTRLSLTEIREAHLGHILSVTPQLRYLDWEWYYSMESTAAANNATINLDEIMDALGHVRATLEELHISASCTYNIIEYPPLFVEGSLASLAGFLLLRRLEAPVPVLMGFAYDRHLEDIIPAALEHLIINSDLYLQDDYAWVGDGPILEEVLQWSQTWARRYPNLRSVALHLESVQAARQGEMGQALSKACVEAGVKLELIPHPNGRFYSR